MSPRRLYLPLDFSGWLHIKQIFAAALDISLDVPFAKSPDEVILGVGERHEQGRSRKRVKISSVFSLFPRYGKAPFGSSEWLRRFLSYPMTTVRDALV